MSTLDTWHCHCACTLECTGVVTPPCHSLLGSFFQHHSFKGLSSGRKMWLAHSRSYVLALPTCGKWTIFPCSFCRLRWESALHHNSHYEYCSNLGKGCWFGKPHYPQLLGLLVKSGKQKNERNVVNLIKEN